MFWQMYYSYSSTCCFGNAEWISEIYFQNFRYMGELINSWVRSTVFNSAQIWNTHVAFEREIFLRVTPICPDINYGFANLFMNRHKIPPRQNHMGYLVTLPDYIEAVEELFQAAWADRRGIYDVAGLAYAESKTSVNMIWRVESTCWIELMSRALNSWYWICDIQLQTTHANMILSLHPEYELCSRPARRSGSFSVPCYSIYTCMFPFRADSIRPDIIGWITGQDQPPSTTAIRITSMRMRGESTAASIHAIVYPSCYKKPPAGKLRADGFTIMKLSGF